MKINLSTRHAHDPKAQIQVGKLTKELLFGEGPQCPSTLTHFQEVNEASRNKNGKAVDMTLRSSSRLACSEALTSF